MKDTEVINKLRKAIDDANIAQIQLIANSNIEVDMNFALWWAFLPPIDQSINPHVITTLLDLKDASQKPRITKWQLYLGRSLFFYFDDFLTAQADIASRLRTLSRTTASTTLEWPFTTDDSKRDLRGIDYRGKTITSISFKDANLRGVLIDDRTQFVSCNAEGAIFVPQILVIAVEQNHLSLVKLVLQSNAAAVKKKGKDSCGDTPLHTAIKKKYVAIALALIVACPEALEVTNNFGETPIDIMVALKQINVIKAVINPTSSVEILEKLYNLSHQHGLKEVQFHLANALVLKKASSMDSGAMTLLKQYVGEAGWYGFFVKGHWNHHYAAQINKLLANEKLTVQDIHGELVKIRTGVGNKWNPQGSLAQIIEAIELLNPSLTATLSRASSVSQISY